MTQASEEVREFLRAAGRKGGQAKSARKQAASRANGKLSQVPAAQRPAPDTILTGAEAHNIVEQLQAKGVPVKFDELYEAIPAPVLQRPAVLISQRPQEAK